LASKIKDDTGNIVRLAINAESSAACIDRRVGGREDGDCNRGNPGDGADVDPSDGSARLGRRGGPGPNPGG